MPSESNMFTNMLLMFDRFALLSLVIERVDFSTEMTAVWYLGNKFIQVLSYAFSVQFSWVWRKIYGKCIVPSNQWLENHRSHFTCIGKQSRGLWLQNPLDWLRRLLHCDTCWHKAVLHAIPCPSYHQFRTSGYSFVLSCLSFGIYIHKIIGVMPLFQHSLF